MKNVLPVERLASIVFWRWPTTLNCGSETSEIELCNKKDFFIIIQTFSFFFFFAENRNIVHIGGHSLEGASNGSFK